MARFSTPTPIALSVGLSEELSEMHFLGWLESQDLKIARIIIADYNNGCLPPVRNVLALKEHFLRRHQYNGEQIAALITEAFIAYSEELHGGHS